VTEVLYKTREGAVSETTWHNVTAWESREVPNVHRITKGMPIYVSGRLRTTKLTNIDGSEKTYYEVLASKMKFVADTEEQ
jgi:single-strand DNA-binding protein